MLHPVAVGSVKYLMFGDAVKIPNGDLVGDFQNNDAWIYGLRLTYQETQQFISKKFITSIGFLFEPLIAMFTIHL